MLWPTHVALQTWVQRSKRLDLKWCRWIGVLVDSVVLLKPLLKPYTPLDLIFPPPC
jgi:hypothetical protein